MRWKTELESLVSVSLSHELTGVQTQIHSHVSVCWVSLMILCCCVFWRIPWQTQLQTKYKSIGGSFFCFVYLFYTLIQISKENVFSLQAQQANSVDVGVVYVEIHTNTLSAYGRLLHRPLVVIYYLLQLLRFLTVFKSGVYLTGTDLLILFDGL